MEFVEGIVSRFYDQDQFPYYVSLIIFQYVVVSIFFVPSFAITIILAIIERLTRSKGRCNRCVLVARNIWIGLTLFFFAGYFAFASGTLFSFFDNQIIPLVLGTILMFIYFMIIYGFYYLSTRPVEVGEGYMKVGGFGPEFANLYSLDFQEDNEDQYKNEKCKVYAKRTALVVLALILAFVLTGATHGICFVFYPHDWSTQFSRMLRPDLCPENGPPCHVYLTLPNNGSTEMIVHFHTSVELPGPPEVRFGDPRDSSNTTIVGKSRKLPNPFVTRYVHSVVINFLKPNTTYYFYAGHPSIGYTSKRLFRTLPLENEYNFVVGGDVGLTPAAVKLLKLAAQREPSFVLVGGDLAYDNSVCSCYYRWDQWLNMWEDTMISPQGYTIPMLPGIGNHDAGGYKRSPEQVKFYFNYFPDPQNDDFDDDFPPLSYHSHIIGNSTFIILDTDHVASTSGDQLQWLQQQLLANTSHRFVAYHVPIYPSKAIQFNESTTLHARKNWVPVFDKYHVDMALEFHVHAYKRTKPLYNDTIVSEGGTVYIGDGCMGVTPIPQRLLYNFPWVAKTESIVHFLYFEMNGNNIYGEAINVDNVVFDSFNVTQST